VVGGKRHPPGPKVPGVVVKTALVKQLVTAVHKKTEEGYWHMKEPQTVNLLDADGKLKGVQLVHLLTREQHVQNNKLLSGHTTRLRKEWEKRLATSTAQGVPLAIPEGFRGSHIYKSYSTDGKGVVTCHVSGHQLLTELLCFSGGGFQRSMMLPISPNMLGGHVGMEGKNYDYFKFDEFEASTMPAYQPSNVKAAGMGVLFYAPNNDYVVTGVGFTPLTIASNFDSFMTESLWVPQSLRADLSNSLTQYSTSDNSDTLEAFQGSFHFGTVDTFGSELQLNYAEASITYAVRLIQPRLDPAFQVFNSTRVQIDWSLTAVAPIKAMVTFRNGPPLVGGVAMTALAGPDFSSQSFIGTLTFDTGVDGPGFGSLDEFISPESLDGCEITNGLTVVVRAFTSSNTTGVYITYLFSDLASAMAAELGQATSGGINIAVVEGALLYANAVVAQIADTFAMGTLSWCATSDYLSM